MIREPSNRKRTASGCSALREQKALKIWREGSASAKPAVSDVFGGGLARTGSRRVEDAIGVGSTPNTHLFELGGHLHLEVDLGVVLRVETEAHVRYKLDSLLVEDYRKREGRGDHAPDP